MKKLFYISISIVLCLLFSLFMGCEKNPLEETGGGSGSGSGTGGDSSQKGTIEGVVTAKDAPKPLLLASVQLLPTDKMTLTDTAGFFRFSDVEPGTYKLQVKRNGYADYTSEDIKVAAGKTVRHDVVLEAIKSDLQILDADGLSISELNLGNSSRGIFLLKNACEAIVEWEIPKLAVDWIAGFSKLSGKLAPGAVDTVMLTIERSKLAEGENEATVYIGTNVGDKKLVIKASVELSFCFTDSYGNEILEADMSSVDQYSFKIKNTGSGTLTWTIGEIEANWLTFVGERNGELSPGESESRTLKVDRTRLEEGAYETALVFKTNAGVKSLLVKNNVEMAFCLENEQGVEITELEFGSASSKNFRIKNSGNGVLTWEVSSVGANWLTLGNKRSGSLQPGSAETITVTIDRTQLSVGDNYATVNISTNAGDKQLDVNAHVELSYQLVNAQGVEISELNLGRTPQGMFKIKNTGSDILELEISPIADWLVLKGATQGQIRHQGEATIELTVDLNKVSEGTHETILHISSPAGDKQLPVRFMGYVNAVGSDYVETVGGVDLPMVAVQGGGFLMGATEEQQDPNLYEGKPVHQVFLDGFYIGKYEVTQAQWEAVMGTTIYQQGDKAGVSDMSNLGVGDDYPMYYVNWNEAVQFCEKLSQLTGKTYRLPTEAEWEYAARGGQHADGTKYAGSNDIDEVAWFSLAVSGFSRETHPVGQKKPNGLGLYDMSGNIAEWCQDWYGLYNSLPTINPQGPNSGTVRILRGGSIWEWYDDCIVASRRSSKPTSSSREYGFRVVCEP